MRRTITHRGWRLAGAGVLAAAAVALAGCAGAPANAEEADLESGKQLFITSCGACHALEDAGTNGRIGPNLDDAFRGARQQGFEESQFAGVVETWIEEAQPPMAQDIVTGVDKENVAAYVASVAGLSQDSEIREQAPFVIRPPVPGGDAPADDPPVLEEGQKIAGPPPGEEGGDGQPADEGEGG
jgi:mono/diheme cytochrome c family protein